MKNRLFNKWYANMNGYFWLPCPLCGQDFGGHEWPIDDIRESSIPDPEHPGNGSRGAGICPDCVQAGEGDKAWAAFEETYGSRWDLTRAGTD